MNPLIIEIGEDFVRIAEDETSELLYWTQDEWVEDPHLVITITNCVKKALTAPNALRKICKIADIVSTPFDTP